MYTTRSLYLKCTLFVFLPYFNILHGQNIRVEYVIEENRTTTIIFRDSITKTIQTFDIISNNPFNELNYSVYSQDSFGWKWYKLSKEEFNKFIPKNYRKEYEPEVENLINESDSILVESGILSYGLDNPLSHIVIAYSAMCHSNEMYIGAKSKYLVINRYGEIVHISKEIEVDICEIFISENNKYIGFNYGSAMNNEYIKSGVRIYEIQNDSLIIDHKFLHPGIAFFEGNKLLLSEIDYSNNDNIKYKIYYMDPTTKTIADYTFSDRETYINSAWQKLDSNGISIIGPDGKKQQLLFDQDFLKKEVK
jgi:hypothetical protein